jgi:hypothetical protein
VMATDRETARRKPQGATEHPAGADAYWSA